MEFKSRVKGAVWPGIPEPQGAALASMMFQLEQSQFYSPEELFQHQRRQLKALFLHAMETVPFYADRFARAGFDPRREISPNTIRRLPVLTRTEFQNAGRTVMTTKLPQGHGKTFESRTSGTTGRAVTVLKTGLTQLLWMAIEMRGHLWHRRDPGGKLAIIRWMDKSRAMAPKGVQLKDWGPPISVLYPDSGRTVILNIASKLRDQAKWLMGQHPDYLLSYSSNLMALAEYFETNGHKIPQLRQILTTSEVVSQELRETCRRVWGVPVVDAYSCEETGGLALQCPEHEHYHVHSENVYLEVVDENGDPCPVGKTGRVVITSLHNFATPLIRYEVGDYAEPGEACPCGRGLPVLKRILGRERNRLILPNGDSEFPYLGEYSDYRAITTAVRQFQFVQRSLEEVEKKMVVTHPLTPEQEEKTKALIVKCLGHPFRITLSYHDEIPRSASGKFEEFVCEVER